MPRKRKITVTDRDGNVLASGDEAVEAPATVKVYDGGPDGEQLYELSGLRAWVDDNSRGDARAVFVTWADPTDTNPRTRGTKPPVVHTVECDIPEDGPGGGGIGPFVVVVE